MIDLRLGDCLEVMKDIPDGSVDMVITDPPYGMSFQSNRSKSGPRHKKIIGDNELDLDWIVECARTLHGFGGMLVFCDWKRATRFYDSIVDCGMNVVSQVIWDRVHHGMGDLRGAFAPRHDVIWYATKGRRVFKNGRPSSVIRSMRPSPSDDNGHPTCKPIDLMIELVGKTADGTVLDPFMGSGTTGVACVKEGRNFIGIELDETYFSIAVNRIEEARKEVECSK